MEKRFSIIEARLRNCAFALRHLLCEVFCSTKPADKILSAFFRENKRFGSTDRRLLSEFFFAVMRWWGFIRKAFPEAAELILPQAIQETKSHLIYKIMLFTAFLEEKLYDENIKYLCRKFDLLEKKFNEIRNSKDFAIKGRLAAQVLNGNNVIFSKTDVLPEWVIEETKDMSEIQLFAEWFQKRSPMWLRGNSNNISALISQLEQEGIKVSQSPFIRSALNAGNTSVNLYTLKSFKDGLFEVQDIASQAIGVVCNAKPGERWWDACAGAGGKSLQLSSMMNNKGTIVATDIREYKLNDLKKRARRAGISNIRTNYWNGNPPNLKKVHKFDGVLVDAPCSCSGTWRRNPDARWTSNKNEISELADIQLKLLKNASIAVKNGGILVYATCSFFKKENEDVVKKFLSLCSSEFKLEPFINPFKNTLSDGMLRIYPWDSDCDSVFIAKFRRLQ